MFDQKVIDGYIDGNAVECPYCKVDGENFPLGLQLIARGGSDA